MEFIQSDRLERNGFRTGYCGICDKTTQQLYQISGIIEFYQCLKCNSLLSRFSGTPLSEGEISLILNHVPEPYKNRPLTELGIIVKVL